MSNALHAARLRSTRARPVAALTAFVSLAAAACAAPTESPPQPTASATPTAAATASATAAAAAPSATSAASAPPPPLPPRARAPGELAGDTIDYAYDARDVSDPTRAYEGRLFVPDAAASTGTAVPLVVFLHGLNKLLIPHRWMGGGTEGDVRRIAADLIARGAIPPVLVAGPGSIQREAVSTGSSFPKFDLDKFLELTEAALPKGVTIDKARIVVTGHSGAGCSDKGGLVAAARSRAKPLAVISIDTCMNDPLAKALGGAPETTNVVVTWQTASWRRNFGHFEAVFRREATIKPPGAGVLRELDELPTLPKAHDATVGQTFEKWLPRILGAGAGTGTGTGTGTGAGAARP